MANTQQTPKAEAKNLKISRIGKFILKNGLYTGIAVMLVVLPSCKGHKHCDAYSSSWTSKKKKRGGLVFSLNQTNITRSHATV